MRRSNILVIGIGYVGLDTALLLGKKNNVYIYDIDSSKYNIKDQAKKEYLKNNGIKLSKIYSLNNLKKFDFIVICVSTDYSFELDNFDMTNVNDVIEKIVLSNTNATIVIRSTVPIRYTENIYNNISKNVIFSPEFARESNELSDIFSPDRIIIGYKKENIFLESRAREFAKIITDSCLDNSIPVIYTSYNEAECIKLFANAYLALRVSFFNELDMFSEQLNLDSRDIIKGVCLDKRIGDYYNNPSFGYGGYCLTKDTRQLFKDTSCIENVLISSITRSNENRIDFIASQIIKKEFSVIGIYRLNFKSNSNSIRKSAIIDIIDRLRKTNVKIIIYEPQIKEKQFKDCEVVNNLKKFKSMSSLILANRYDDKLHDVNKKVYTRDIFRRD